MYIYLDPFGICYKAQDSTKQTQEAHYSRYSKHFFLHSPPLLFLPHSLSLFVDVIIFLNSDLYSVIHNATMWFRKSNLLKDDYCDICITLKCPF